MEGNTLKSPRIQKTKSPSPPSLSPSSSPSLSPSLYDNLDEDEIIVRFDGKKVIYNKKKDKEAIQKPKSPSPPSLSPSSSPSLSPSLYDNLDEDEIIVRINGKKVIYNKKKDKEAIKKPKSPPLSSSRGGQKKNVIRIRRIKKY
jgi:ribosomal protein L16 Arg81 hydroxylase